MTEGLSIISIGRRAAPVNSETIFTKVFCWFAAVVLSKQILDTACPVVPEDVIVLNISSSGIKDLPLNRIAPNLVTLFALSSGVTSIRFAMEGRFQWAVFAILMAAVFDALDGGNEC